MLLVGVAKALRIQPGTHHLDLAPVGPHRQEVRIEAGADGNLLGAAGLLPAGADSLRRGRGLLALLAHLRRLPALPEHHFQAEGRNSPVRKVGI